MPLAEERRMEPNAARRVCTVVIVAILLLLVILKIGTCFDFLLHQVVVNSRLPENGPADRTLIFLLHRCGEYSLLKVFLVGWMGMLAFLASRANSPSLWPELALSALSLMLLVFAVSSTIVGEVLIGFVGVTDWGDQGVVNGYVTALNLCLLCALILLVVSFASVVCRKRKTHSHFITGGSTGAELEVELGADD